MESTERPIRGALHDATAEGIRSYLPGGVGILARGIPVLALAVLAHLLLDVSAQLSLGGGLAGGGLHELVLHLPRRG